MRSTKVTEYPAVIHLCAMATLSASDGCLRATRFNATIGIALENGELMHLGVIQDELLAFEPKDLYEYVPHTGKLELRTTWRKKLLD